MGEKSNVKVLEGNMCQWALSFPELMGVFFAPLPLHGPCLLSATAGLLFNFFSRHINRNF